MGNEKSNGKSINEGYQPKKRGYQPSTSDMKGGYRPKSDQEQPPSPPTKE